LTNLQVGFELNEINFLIDSGAALSSLAFHPPCMQLSSDSLLVSGLKGEGSHVPLFRKAPVRNKDRQTKVVFLSLCPSSRNQSLGLRLNVRIGDRIKHTSKTDSDISQPVVSEEEQQTLPEVWTRDRN
jgi:hypothetical protein